ncbi:DUF305 domain-containing protein [Spirochaeta dissipatitropha]
MYKQNREAKTDNLHRNHVLRLYIYLPAVFLVLMAPVLFAQGMMGSGRMMQPGEMMGPDGMMAAESEAEFLAMMIPHHQEAVDRSIELLQLTQRLEMAELLESIVVEQSAEIELMRAWLESRHPDTVESDSYVPMMRDYDGLTPEEADKVFLEDMHMHHMHAVMSSRMLLRLGDEVHEDTRQLAESIIKSQLDEIRYMQQLYREWY